jgi:hypothetical protein
MITFSLPAEVATTLRTILLDEYEYPDDLEPQEIEPRIATVTTVRRPIRPSRPTTG